MHGHISRFRGEVEFARREIARKFNKLIRIAVGD